MCTEIVRFEKFAGPFLKYMMRQRQVRKRILRQPGRSDQNILSKFSLLKRVCDLIYTAEKNDVTYF